MRNPFRRTGLIAATLVTCIFAFAPLLQAQNDDDPTFVGLHVGNNLSNFSDRPIDVLRVGGQMLLPVRGALRLYPTASVHLDRAQWQVSALVRIDPTPYRATVPFYFGGGVSYINWDGPGATFYDVLFWGLKAHVGRYEPFLEMQFFDGIHRLTTRIRGNFGVQLYVGVNRVLR